VTGPVLIDNNNPAYVAGNISLITKKEESPGVNMLSIFIAQMALAHNTFLSEFIGSVWLPVPQDSEYFAGISRFHFPIFGPNPNNKIEYPFLQGFFLYGGKEREERLRDGDKMLVDKYNMPPRSIDVNVSMSGSPQGEQYATGDERGSENSFLTVVHTIWIRWHNYLVLRGYSFEEAKEQVIIDIQSMIYKELLPVLLGPYSDCSNIQPIKNLDITFSVILRIHSMVNSAILGSFERVDINSLRDIFFDPLPLQEMKGNLKPFILSMYETPAFKDTLRMDDDMNRHLFERQPNSVFSLGAVNSARGPDLQLSDFNSAREAQGLSPYQTYEEFVDDQEVLAFLYKFYPGGPSTCPIWICVRAEKNAAGSSMGETSSVWFQQQLCGLRSFLPLEKATPFTEILCKTTGACGLKYPFSATGTTSNIGILSFLLVAFIMSLGPLFQTALSLQMIFFFTVYTVVGSLLITVLFAVFA